MTTFHKHHRQLRRSGNDDWGNLIHLPTEIHDLVHANPEVAYQYGLLVSQEKDPAAIEPDIPGFCAHVGFEGILGGAEKPKRPRKKDAERRARTRLSVAVPKDTEDGGGIWDDTLEEVKQRLFDMGLINPDEYPDPQKYPNYEAIIAAWRDWLNS